MSMRKIYRKIAKQHGISVQEVRAEMQHAIHEAWTKPSKSLTEIKTQAKVPHEGEIPTIEEFFHYAEKKLK